MARYALESLVQEMLSAVFGRVVSHLAGVAFQLGFGAWHGGMIWGEERLVIFGWRWWWLAGGRPGHTPLVALAPLSSHERGGWKGYGMGGALRRKMVVV